jgi:ATP-dependent DNA ligase
MLRSWYSPRRRNSAPSQPARPRLRWSLRRWNPERGVHPDHAFVHASQPIQFRLRSRCCEMLSSDRRECRCRCLLKYDGFRALAYVEHGRCRLVSRNSHQFSCFDSLASSLAKIPHEGGLILDGEIACVDAKGRPCFNDLLFRRREPCFFAFDLLCLNGNDYRRDSLAQRKLALRQLLNSGRRSAAIYVDHVEGEGTALYRRVCELDLEGIVAKHKDAPYISERTISTWYKIRNPQYSQMIGRHELFERERHSEPIPGWHGCDLVCTELDYAKL